MVLRENEMRLPTLSEYLWMLNPICDSNDNGEINTIGFVTTGCMDEFYLVQTSEHGYRMMPGPEFGPRLYRGQTKRYPTCKPQVFRNLTPFNYGQKYIEAIYWTAKRVELSVLLEHHPAIRDIMAWDFDGLSFDLDIQALAQHYLYPTQMLDLSRSKDVAMFFATHEFFGDVKHPTAAIGSNAVIYTIDIKKMLHDQDTNYRLVPVGVDPL
ncbi:FRG domain-containing protein [Methylococcus mesophilus]|uniref:FRG domain-containing protein n=1 Tax=Methylococcus mesophilus TaxID=2993564 RepID=UPI00224AF46A|nr:FRG domain-containing protein [Methylococcus mesophilus]UZR30642.1 FRG domain-containing protein [Methylococcus mesophilus]